MLRANRRDLSFGAAFGLYIGLAIRGQTMVAKSRKLQQVFGGVMLALGGGVTCWSWFTALSRGYYYPKAAVIFPAFAVVGLALIFIPGYREERIARGEDISQLSGTQLLTRRWWIVLAIAMIVGMANFFLIR